LVPCVASTIPTSVITPIPSSLGRIPSSAIDLFVRGNGNGDRNQLRLRVLTLPSLSIDEVLEILEEPSNRTLAPRVGGGAGA